jgi:hypothetical protein
LVSSSSSSSSSSLHFLGIPFPPSWILSHSPGRHRVHGRHPGPRPLSDPVLGHPSGRHMGTGEASVLPVIPSPQSMP